MTWARFKAFGKFPQTALQEACSALCSYASLFRIVAFPTDFPTLSISIFVNLLKFNLRSPCCYYYSISCAFIYQRSWLKSFLGFLSLGQFPAPSPDSPQPGHPWVWGAFRPLPVTRTDSNVFSLIRTSTGPFRGPGRGPGNVFT